MKSPILQRHSLQQSGSTLPAKHSWKGANVNRKKARVEYLEACHRLELKEGQKENKTGEENE